MVGWKAWRDPDVSRDVSKTREIQIVKTMDSNGHLAVYDAVEPSVDSSGQCMMLLSLLLFLSMFDVAFWPDLLDLISVTLCLLQALGENSALTSLFSSAKGAGENT